ncbi:GNAT family N-acetyltransferase [Mechercharimyces sp. CAU 1602]|uniref:GNAT family N-acetyltransferase n=1 Tax=Mechercharimyces sp. CAU 1602 TaxID=2973933 RepID=UPI002162076C|nr:GNAT family protein [Mechercharimyces sp. CAU 1602]
MQLIQWTPDHASDLFRLIETNRTHLSPWLPWIKNTNSLHDIQSYIQRSLIAASKQEFHFGIWLDQQLIGSVTIERLHAIHRVAEIGYWVAKEMSGKGYMELAVRRLIAYLFQDLKLNRLEIRCTPANQRSQRIPQKVGFCYEGRLCEAIYMNGRFHDLLIYGLTYTRWDELERLPKQDNTDPAATLSLPPLM